MTALVWPIITKVERKIASSETIIVGRGPPGRDDDDRRVELVATIPCHAGGAIVRVRLGFRAGTTRTRRAGLGKPERLGLVQAFENAPGDQRSPRRDAL